MLQKKLSQKGQAFIAIAIVGVLIFGLLFYFVFARREEKVEKGALSAPLVSIKSDKSDKIKLLGNQPEPHTVLLGNKKGIRFFDESYGELMRITPDGKVGIGTPSPTERLTVNGNLVVSGAIYGSAFCLAGDCKIAWPTGGESYWALTEENVYNLNPGNIGIGTQEPTEKLEVAGKIKAEGICIGTDCRTSWPTGGPVGGIGGSGTTNYLSKWAGSTSLGNSILYDTGTNIGIGSNQPSTRLSILSNVDNILKLVRTGAPSSYLWAIGIDGKLALKDQADNIRFALDPGGNIGIGTATPGQKLEVTGYIKGTGFCIGANCITSWPAGGPGGGDITAVSAGTGLSGGGTSGDVTLSANLSVLQKRITESCPEGSAIRAISQDGVVTCQNVGIGPGGGTLGGSGTPPALTRWLGTPGSSSTTLGNSVVYQVGSNIGIGTDIPAQKLHIDGVTQAAVFYASTGISTFDTVVSPQGTIEASRFCLGNGTNCITSWPTGEGVSYWTQSGSNLYPNNTAWNVGIGTTSPSYKLDISGDVRWTGTLQGGSVPWARLTSFPSPCLSGQYVSGIGTGGLTCSTPAGAGGGTVTQINQGAGITLSPNPITTTGTISLATQNCSSGQFVTGIGGTISCATPPAAGGGDITAVFAGTGLSGGGTSGDVTLRLNTAAISTCTGATTQKVIWDSTNNRLNCATDQTGAGGGITGSGTANRVAKWTSSSAIGNSNVFDDGSSVGIGGILPGYAFVVAGSAPVAIYGDLVQGTGTGNRAEFSGEVTIGGVTGEGTGKVICVKDDYNLGTCKGGVAANGTCLCQ